MVLSEHSSDNLKKLNKSLNDSVQGKETPQKLSIARQGNLDEVITKDYPSRQAWWHVPVTPVPVKGREGVHTLRYIKIILGRHSYVFTNRNSFATRYFIFNKYFVRK